MKLIHPTGSVRGAPIVSTTCTPSQPAPSFLARLIVFVIVLFFFVVILVLGCPAPVAIPLAAAGAFVAQALCDPGSVSWQRLNVAPGPDSR